MLRKPKSKPRDSTSHLLEWLLSARQVITSVEEVVKKKDPSFTASGNVNWYSHYGKQYGSFSKKLKIELPYDPAIPLLGIYPQNLTTFIRKDISTPMFIVALFMMAKTWRQPKCPLIED